MRVVIAGGHGKIARLLLRELTGRGDTAVGLIRNPDHAAALSAAGAHPVVADLEHLGVDELAGHLDGADAVVFAAGAGPGSGAARKDTVDRAAAVLLADAAQRAGVRRYLLVSSMGVEGEPRPGTDEVFAAYLRAKKAAEDDVTGRDLDWTVLRPGRLTDDPPTGRITLQRRAPRGAVTRTDVARVLVALLYAPATAGMILELVGGDTPIGEAVAAVTTS
ncbi:NAD(P)H-binding protein [Micromonospora sp. C28SCA-DRY-2]|uniref:NAD(P)H-binding protein n=1 Tax=Micromonospora sp. C28SCA-DRY-2 TaxID=3059522 RepID=UPI0026773432|nr:NAD(P)H-binding protein [Micromonospora sp. C28SCA-DRY-2]MDO3705665.1 NAD(P)H-binding protein [Micromonospora sp. C28SCA-DRY-2]